MTPAHSSHRRPSPAAIFLIPLAVAVVLTLFAWPNARLAPREVPVGVAGAPIVEQKLVETGDSFEVRRYASEDAARGAIEDREVYGAFVGTPAGPTVLVASAAGQPISQALTHAASELEAPVEDVVAAKPAGAGLGASVLPMVLAGILTGAAAVALGTGFRQRAARCSPRG